MSDQLVPPTITDEVLTQWYEAALLDLDRGKYWETHPLAIIAVITELRERRREDS